MLSVDNGVVAKVACVDADECESEVEKEHGVQGTM